MPVFTKEKSTLRPVEVVALLMGSLIEKERICSMQPLRVEHHRSFVVDLEALRSVNDVKCNNMGSWQNNSSDKFYFEIDADEDGDLIVKMVDKASSGSENVVVLKREYYSLNDGIHNDMRRRIDMIQSISETFRLLMNHLVLEQFGKVLCQKKGRWVREMTTQTLIVVHK